MKAWPSACVPRMATKRLPGATRRESICTPVISTSAAPTMRSGAVFFSKSLSFISISFYFGLCLVYV